ncbi:uncharacterized protein LOC135943878 [Cloeon dipterum]|uniref:uncharacterized protein LOC135943878 n=1 Tax=Cloeon dipterum TaxID=197152 RepID=UPI00321F90D5
MSEMAESGVKSQTVAMDASPGEFPYVVKLNLLDETYPKTVPGLVVSGRYLLTSNEANVNGNVSNMEIIDQLGVFRTPFKIQQIVSALFTYVKFCRIFRGTKFPMTASLFNDLSTNVSATVIFFNNTSPVPRKVAAIAYDSVTCDTAEKFGDTTKKICMKKDDTVGFCTIFTDSSSGPTTTYQWYLMLAINGQVQGVNANIWCNANGDMGGHFLFDNINSYRSDIINAIPSVDIK